MTLTNKDSKDYFILSILCNMLRYSDFEPSKEDSKSVVDSYAEIMIFCKTVESRMQKSIEALDVSFDDTCGQVDHIAKDCGAKEIKQAILYIFNKCSSELGRMIQTKVYRDHLLNTGHVTMNRRLIKIIENTIEIQYGK